MLFLTADILVEAEELDVGETARYDHENCPAGEDTRGRLYLTRPSNSPDIVLAYCHNCQDSAVYRKKERQSWRTTWSDTKIPQGPEFEVPKGMTDDWDLWPPSAQALLTKAGCDRRMAKWYGIEYHPTYDRLYFPIYNEKPSATSELVGYQLRSLDKLNSPKYLTALKDNDQSYYTRLNGVPNGSPDWIVIVEDLMSGLRVRKATMSNVPRIDVLVNYGVKLNLDALNDNRDAKEGYLVWLDNDAVNVEERAREISRTWTLLTGKPCAVIDTHTDPKGYRIADIRLILEDKIGQH